MTKLDVYTCLSAVLFIAGLSFWWLAMTERYQTDILGRKIESRVQK